MMGPHGMKVKTEIKAEDGLQVRMSGDEGVQDAARWLYEDLTAVVKALENDLRGANLALIWVKGEKVLPEEVPSRAHRALGRLFSRTLLMLSILMFAFNIALFLIFGIPAVIAILGLQFLLMVYADKFFGLMGKWKITPELGVYLLQIR